MRTDLDVVDSLGVGEIGVYRSIGKSAVLANRSGLQIRRPKIGQWIVTGVVVVVVSADEGAEIEDRVTADDARIGRGNIEGPDLGVKPVPNPLPPVSGRVQKAITMTRPKSSCTCRLPSSSM